MQYILKLLTLLVPNIPTSLHLRKNYSTSNCRLLKQCRLSGVWFMNPNSLIKFRDNSRLNIVNHHFKDKLLLLGTIISPKLAVYHTGRHANSLSCSY